MCSIWRTRHFVWEKNFGMTVPECLELGPFTIHEFPEKLLSFSLCRSSVSSAMGHVRYINIPTWILGFRVKVENCLSFFCFTILQEDLETKKTLPNIDASSESLAALSKHCGSVPNVAGLFSCWLYLNLACHFIHPALFEGLVCKL